MLVVPLPFVFGSGDGHIPTFWLLLYKDSNLSILEPHDPGDFGSQPLRLELQVELYVTLT